MQEIQGQARTVKQLLGLKYAIDYYQREYKWEQKQIQELMDDLTSRFLDDYRPGHPRPQVKMYGRYFLGSVIISKKDNTNYVVDGQQRLTSLTLLLLFLRNLQKDRADKVAGIDNLIYSEQFGEKSFNLDVPERAPAMRALFDEQTLDPVEQSESVRNILARYHDITDYFPEELGGEALPYFIDWLTENVHLVEITAYSDDDAYTIFETMNDRGLSLSPTEMLKGFLLANIGEDGKRTAASDRWRQRTNALREVGKETEADFFKAWLRSQYAVTIRDRKKGARPGDFDRIGTEFHRWVRDHADEKHDDELVIKTSDDFYGFIERDFNFYAKVYKRLIEASKKLVEGWERVLYNAWQGFTLQYMMLLAPLTPEDSEEAIRTKVRLVSLYLDVLLSRRVWNYHRNSYSSMYYGIFMATKAVRGLEPIALAERLMELYKEEQRQEINALAFNDWLGMHQQNRWTLHLVLARLTEYVERESGNTSRYLEYVGETGKNRYEVEHIWPNTPARFRDEFPDPTSFQNQRNRLGGLLLLPKKFNASYQDDPYEKKAKHYYKENLLAASLYPQTYENNPGFLSFVKRSGLPFQAHEQFTKADLEERQALYRQIAERIWDPDQLAREVGACPGD